MSVKYTKEILEPLVKNSRSYLEVLKKLGIKSSGSIHTHIKNRISIYKIDTSHFLGKAANKGGKYHTSKLPNESILVNARKNRRETIARLRRVLLDSGLEEKCKECNLLPIWNNKRIVLQVDHINGDCLDNRIENLRFLCPNCHSQTDTFGYKKK
jgi:hypothetical protein